MDPELENSEMKKYAAQQELMTILDKKSEVGAPLARLSTKATIPLDVEKGNHEYNFCELMAPKLRDAQVLDLFCGANSFKNYVQEHGFPGSVTGVDIDSEKADITADVAKIDQVLPPTGQFDIVTSCGSVPGVEDYETSAKYLKSDGLYVMGASLEWMNEDVLPLINDPDLINNLSPTAQADARKFLRFFKPVVAVDVLDIPNSFGIKDLSDSYLICSKQEEENKKESDV